MSNQRTSIFHCERCGNVVYEDEPLAEPRCCDTQMTKVVSEFVWEVDEQGIHKVSKGSGGIVNEIRAEHQDLIRRLAVERDAWNQIEKPTDANCAELHNRLCGFREQLAGHFAHEEQGGYLTHVLEAAPSLERQVAKLRLQHSDFLERLDNLISRLSVEPPESWKEARADFGKLTVELRGHEAAETALAQLAFSDSVETAH